MGNAKTFGLALAALLLSLSLHAQRRHGDFQRFSDRLFFGGSFGLAVGNLATQIDVAPVAGVWVIPHWAVGGGGRYSFRKERFGLISGGELNRSTHIWGLSGFTQILPIPDFHETFNIDIHGGIVLHAEYEGLYMDRQFFDALAPNSKGWTHIYLVGGGWRQRVGDRAAIHLMLLWDLSGSRYSPYTGSPIVRFSITF